MAVEKLLTLAANPIDSGNHKCKGQKKAVTRLQTGQTNWRPAWLRIKATGTSTTTPRRKGGQGLKTIDGKIMQVDGRNRSANVVLSLEGGKAVIHRLCSRLYIPE